MVRAVALLLTVLTGFSGLVYEVAWQKYLSTLLGSHSEATAAILALFLGGLSCGYALFGRVAAGLVRRRARQERAPTLLWVYGAVEATIGVWAWLFPGLFAAVRAVSLSIPHGAGGAGFGLDVGLAALLLIPPTVLMGGTIPLLTQALAHDLNDATRFHALVYAFNTAGAFIGALAAGFILIPRLGLHATLNAMGGVNLVVGATFLWLGRRWGAAMAGAAVAAPPASPVRGFNAFAFAAFTTGFGMMVIQTTLNRLGGLAFGASQFTFSMVVAVFVLCIALGSFAVSARARIAPPAAFAALAALAVSLAVLYPFMQDAPYWAHEIRRRFGHGTSDFYPYWFANFGWMLVVLALPIGLSGAVLPLLFHVLRREVRDLGAVAGRLYSWNTFGSVCGALLGGYALLFWLDLHQVYRIAVAALALGAAVLGTRLLQRRRALVVATFVALVVVVALLPRWSALRLSSGPFRARATAAPSGAGPGRFFAAYEAQVTVPFYDDDPTTSVAVWEGKKHGAIPSRAIVNNGKSDGEIPADYCTMALIAALPALLADRVESAFVIGYGTGVTAGDLGRIASMRRVDVAEIARGVLQAAPLFEYGNEQAAHNPKLHLVRSDAYRALVRSRGGYDIIASEPSNPWVTGVEMLYSREFLQVARDRLAPGGVYAQWFHLYETDDATVALILRTYKAVFADVAVWYALADDLVLLGFKDGASALDVERLEQRVESPDYAAVLAQARIRGMPGLLAHELWPVGVLKDLPLPGNVHTLYHPRLSDLAARAFFRGGAAQLPAAGRNPVAAVTGGRNALLGRWSARHAGGLPDSLRFEVVAETLKYRPELAATLLAQWEIQQPGSVRLARMSDAFWKEGAERAQLRPNDYARLQYLFEGGSPPACDPALGIATLFERFYHFGAPFAGAALDRALERCPETHGVTTGHAATRSDRP